MKKTLEEIIASKAGSSEQSSQTNPEGMYVLDRGEEFPEFPEEGEVGRYDRIPVVGHPKFGTTQADAYTRLGYKWERDLEPSEKVRAKFAPETTASQPAQATAQQYQNQIDALTARLNAMESASKAPQEAPATVEKPMKLWNKTQLLEKAAELGLEVTDEATNKQILEAIEAALGQK